MSRNIPLSIQQALNTRATTLAVLVKIIRHDGRVFCYTDHDEPIDLDIDGSGILSFVPAISFNRSTISTSDSMNVDTTDVEAVIDADNFSEDDLYAGKFDDATVKIALIDWSNVGAMVKMRSGLLGQVERRDFNFKVELRNLTQWIQQNVVSLASPTCRSVFGDTGSGSAGGCRFPVIANYWQSNHAYIVGDQVRPTTENGYQFICTVAGTSDASSPDNEPTWPTSVDSTVTDGSVTWKARRATARSADVSGVTNRRVFDVDNIFGDLQAGTGGTPTGGFFVLGSATFMTGNNIGVCIEIVSFEVSVNSPGGGYTVTTFLPFPFDIVAGDRVMLKAGCDQSLTVCKTIYDNVINFRGEPYLPGADAIFKVTKSGKSGGKK